MFKVVPDNSTQNYAQSCFNISITWLHSQVVDDHEPTQHAMLAQL
jgi:hypothetical protein